MVQMNLPYYVLIVGLCLISLSCSNDLDEVEKISAEYLQANKEWGNNVKIIYSDSAVVKLVIHAPLMERYTDYSESRDEFPKGVLLEFMNPDKKIISWLKADMAIREDKTQKITARGNVIFQNEKNEKLETPELVWDEKERIVYTDKLVRITNAEKGDTTYGFGFRANQEFNRFEIRRKVQGKINVSDMTSSLE